MRSWWQRRQTSMRGPGGQRGALELFFVGIAMIAFVVIGLVVDLGAQLNSTSQADYVAQEAARAGAQQVDPGQAIAGTAIVVDPDAAQAAADGFLEAKGVDGDVSVAADGQKLTVTVHDTYHPIFASLLGYTQMPVTGHGSATLLHQAGG